VKINWSRDEFGEINGILCCGKNWIFSGVFKWPSLEQIYPKQIIL
jgi:hypothetical protein